MSVLPAYEARAEVQVSDLKQVLENTRIEDPEKAVDELYKELGSVDVGPIIKALGNDIVSIKDDFDSIYSTLGLLDEQGYKKKSVDGSSDDDPIPKFQPEWGKIRKNFEEQIWESKKIATEGAARANSYRTVMVPMIKDDGVPIEAKKAELDHFIKEIEATTNSAQRMAESFLELPTRIKDFRVRLSKALVQVGLNFTGKIQQLKQDVNSLIEKIRGHEKMRESAVDWARKRLNVKSMGVSLLCNLSSLLGIDGTKILLNATTIGTEKSSLPNVVDIVKEVRSELSDLTDRESGFVLIEEVVKQSLGRTTHLVGRLIAIAEVWAAIRTEAQEISIAMKSGGQCPTEYGFRLYLRDDKVASPYKKLEQALRVYASQVKSD
ncbi:Serine/threonine-protein kinase [Ceratobasidium sp. AG-Ba]|nr:Serine/threonine-protein kinase [Ceratobasidium sp. AG-Ba]